MLRRLRSSLQGATFIGAAMIALIWISIDVHLKIYRDKSEAAAFQDTRNLARVFEEHIVRVINEIDKTILLARNSYFQDPDGFDLQNWVRNPFLLSNFALQLSFLDPEGTLKTSTRPLNGAVLNFADRDHFRVQAEAGEDAMFIAKPTVGRRSGQWSVQISRGVRDKDGRFRGVISASLDPGLIAGFYRSIDIGKDGGILLLGLDGVVRAHVGFRNNIIGRSMRDANLFQHLQKSPTGSFITRGRMDGITRLVSYRAVHDLPLVLYVGRSEREVLADFVAARRNYTVVASGLTLLILFAVGISIRNRFRLDAAREALEVSEARATEKSNELSVTLDNINQGIMMIDRAGQVPVFNGRLIDMLELPERFREVGWTYKELMTYLWERGDFGPDGANLDPRLRDFIRRGEVGDSGVYERVRPNGTVLEVHSVALRDGGVVRTFTDITERRRSLEKIAHMARHDNLTGLGNRVLLREGLEQSINRLRRYDEPFAVLCLDLDGFKAVNDSLGHAAGDAVLKMAAQRLSAALREVDLVVRLGGDEFAIVMANAEDRAQVTKLADRILETVSTPYVVDGRNLSIRTSIGVAFAPADGEEVDRLLRRGDLALYRAKAEGRNRCRFYEPELEHGPEAGRVAAETARERLAEMRVN